MHSLLSMKQRISRALVCLALFGGVVTAAERADLDRGRALENTPEGAAALARVLADYHHRGEGEAGFSWWMRLPFSVRATQVRVAAVRHWRYRVEFLRDATRGDATACRFSGTVVLSESITDCAYSTELQRYLACTGVPPPVAMQDQVVEHLTDEARSCPDRRPVIRDLLSTLSAQLPR
jgi:hypothetical protein